MSGRINSAVLVVALSLLTGCSGSGVGSVGRESREAITYAATAKYPGGAQKSDRVQITAVNDDREHATVLYNLANQSHRLQSG